MKSAEGGDKPRGGSVREYGAEPRVLVQFHTAALGTRQRQGPVTSSPPHPDILAARALSLHLHLHSRLPSGQGLEKHGTQQAQGTQLAELTPRLLHPVCAVQWQAQGLSQRDRTVEAWTATARAHWHLARRSHSRIHARHINALLLISQQF